MTRNKKIKIGLIFSLLICIISILFSSSRVNARDELNNNPYNTYTVGLEGELVSSPLAYEGVNVLNIGLVSPQDLFIDKNNVCFIADKDLKSVIRYDIDSATTTVIRNDLPSPSGVCTDTDGNIYVACEKSVFKLDPTGEIIKEYTRPTEALFGEDSQYRPTKVVVDMNGNIFITSEGNSNGIIQLNNDGEFMGYFGPNNVNLTLQLFFKRLFLSKEDRETYASLTPKATTNLTIDNKNIVYTVIDGEAGVSLKKYNISGVNVLAKAGFFSNSYQDITVDSDGFIYAVCRSTEGVVQVMDTEGTLLFSFGSTRNSSLMMGEFDSASGIAIDKNKNIWVLDNGGKSIQIFRKTEFATTVTNAILAYNEGNYDKAEEYYHEIIRQNASFVSAYIGLGKIYQRLEKYNDAIHYFKLANYKTGYSEVFWELRDNWFNRNLVWMIIVLFVLIIIFAFKLHKKLWKLTKIDLSRFKEKINSYKLTEELKYLFRILRKPNDVFYDIKYGLKIRQRTAWGIFLVFILINIFGDYFIRGYIFRGANASDINFAFELLRWGLVIFLLVIGNYLISTLQSGEGFFRDIFIGTIYSFAPLILFKLPIDILSNALTYNEGYLYTIFNALLWIWSIFNVILMIKEIHNYKVGELILNIILTFVAVIIMILLFLVLYILTMQLIEFFIGVFSEVGYRS